MRLTLSSDLHGDTGSAMFCANGKQEFLMLSFVRIGHWPCTQKKNYRTSSIQDGCEELQMVCPQNTKTLRHRISFILYVLLLISLWCAFFFFAGKTSTRAVSSHAVLQEETLSPPTPLDSRLFGNWCKKTNNSCKTGYGQMHSTNISRKRS